MFTQNLSLNSNLAETVIHNDGSNPGIDLSTTRLEWKTTALRFSLLKNEKGRCSMRLSLESIV